MGEHPFLTDGSKLELLVSFVDTKTKWKCFYKFCGREVVPTYSKVKSGYRGCLCCAGKKVDLEDAISLMRMQIGIRRNLPLARLKAKWSFETRRYRVKPE